MICERIRTDASKTRRRSAVPTCTPQEYITKRINPKLGWDRHGFGATKSQNTKSTKISISRGALPADWNKAGTTG